MKRKEEKKEQEGNLKAGLGGTGDGGLLARVSGSGSFLVGLG